ncbi:MAG: hypothetical protein DRO65_04100, partial [Candidatus Altiarchaeales archaeon]
TIIYALFVGISWAIFAIVYNVIVAIIGGIEIELEDKK